MPSEQGKHVFILLGILTISSLAVWLLWKTVDMGKFITADYLRCELRVNPLGIDLAMRT